MNPMTERCPATSRGTRCEREAGHPGHHSAGDELDGGAIIWLDRTSAERLYAATLAMLKRKPDLRTVR
jgi:hypothetical protein